MKEIAPKLWVGADADFKELDQFGTEWAIVHAAKFPYHRDFVGYTTPAAPEGPYRLLMRKGKRLALNLIDGPDPKYVTKSMIDTAMAFIDEQLAALEGADQLLIHCNQGRSRAPTLGMLYLAPSLPESFEEAEAKYREIYPDYAPANGIREFARIHWRSYRNRKATGATQKPETGDLELDKARELYERFADQTKSAPDKAVANLISSIACALKDAGAKQDEPRAHGTMEKV